MIQNLGKQFVIFVGSFVLLWFALSQINFIDSEKSQELSEQKEELLGNIFIEQLIRSSGQIENGNITIPILSIFDKICEKNNIDTSKITLYVIQNEEVNAFAFPGNNIVLHSGLIKFCNTPEELTSVLAHELAHIEKRHVMKKLTKEIGVSLLTAVIGSNGNNEIIAEMIHMVTSNYYSRDLEREADIVAVDYLANTGIDPTCLANFLFRFSTNYSDQPKALEWVSSHPDAKERAAYVLELTKEKEVDQVPILAEESWKEIIDELELLIR